MTPKQISEQLVALHTALVEKTGEQPFIEACVRVSQRGVCSISLYRGYNNGDYELGKMTNETLKGLFQDAFAFIAALPDHEVAAKRKFQKNLANVIDEGNGLNMPNEVMKPLSDGMTALSENLLTHQPEAAQ